MDKAIEACRDVKGKYEACLSKWHVALKNFEPLDCEDDFMDYKKCIRDSLAGKKSVHASQVAGSSKA